MRASLRRQLWVMRAYMIVVSLALVVLATAAFRQPASPPPPQNLGEITVERINLVDKDGTLRMVIADKDRMHPGVLDGKVIERARPVAGIIFFNDEGDEVGGLTYSGRVANGQRAAQAGITFDQLKQDQTIGLRYSESNGQRTAALEVWDRSDRPLSELIDALNAANRLTDPAQREAEARVRRQERRQGRDDGSGRRERQTAIDADGRRDGEPTNRIP
jgi:hypothetical protein